MKKKKRENEEEEEEDEVEIAAEEREAKTKRETAITGDERRKNDSCINTARPGVYIYVYIYVSPRDVELSSCPMMDVYHVRQRQRHLLHHRLLFLFLPEHSSALFLARSLSGSVC